MNLCILLIFHILGDFIFQSSQTARAKHKPGKEGRYALSRHLLLYTLTAFLSTMWWGYWWDTLLLTLMISVTHAVVDVVCIRLHRWFPRRQLPLFLADQAVHVILLVGASQMLGRLNEAGRFVRYTLLGGWESDDLYHITLAILLALICTAPAAVLVKKVFSLISASVPEEKKLEPARQVDVYRSGFVIGVCERLIILILGIAGQFGAVGFVLAAKSLARFKLINDDKDFAERYLVGTLVRALVAIVFVLAWNCLQ